MLMLTVNVTKGMEFVVIQISDINDKPFFQQTIGFSGKT